MYKVNYYYIRRQMKVKKVNFKMLSEQLNMSYRTLTHIFEEEKDMKTSLLFSLCEALELNVHEVVDK